MYRYLTYGGARAVRSDNQLMAHTALGGDSGLLALMARLAIKGFIPVWPRSRDASPLPVNEAS
jgi:hypothetical protein